MNHSELIHSISQALAKGDQENDAADAVDPGPGARAESAIEDIHPDVAVAFQRERRAEHEYHGVHVGHGFLHGYRNDSQAVA